MCKKIIYGIMLVGMFMAENAFGEWGAWSNWSYRKEVIIDNTTNSSSLTDYQVLVTLGSDFNYSHANNDGSDVRFANISGNALSYWIATWSTTGTSTIWVKVDSIPANDSTTIYMYYGNPATTTTTANFDDTFTKDFGESGLVGLWHVDEGSGTTVYDFAGQGNTGTMYNFVSPNGWVGTDGGQWDGRSDVNFSVGDHLKFNGSNNYVIVANESNFDFERTDPFSIEAWVKATVGAGGAIVVKSAIVPGWGFFPGYLLYFRDSIGFNLLHYNDGNEIDVRGGTNLNDGNWHHIVMTYNGSSDANGISLYSDGNSLTKTIIWNNLTGTILNDWRLNIGARQDGTDMFFNGSIDEVRIYNRVLSPDEIKTHYERRKYTDTQPIATVRTPTYVSGTITENTTWNIPGSPYIITSDVIVAQGVTLNIKPNVVVKFATDTSLISYGVLTAIGTPDGTITFTSNKPTPQAGDWRRIKFSESQSKGTISYCLIEYGEQAVYLEDVTGIVITNNLIQNNKGNEGGSGQQGNVGSGIYLFSSPNNIIGSNTITNSIGGNGGNTSGEWGGRGGIGTGIYLLYSNSNDILNNIILNNEGGNGGVAGYWMPRAGGSGGIATGVYLSSSTNNYIIGNQIADNIGGDGGDSSWSFAPGQGGLATGIYLSSSSTNNILDTNTILNSKGGKGGPRYSGGRATDGSGLGIYIDSSSFDNIINTSNKYNGEPTYYYYGTSSITIEGKTIKGSGTTNLGRITLINCTNFKIKNNTISGGRGCNGIVNGEDGGVGAGIYLYLSDSNEITANDISDNEGGIGASGICNSPVNSRGGVGAGIYLYSSSYNIIKDNNNIRDNRGGQGGISVDSSGGGRGGIGCSIYLTGTSTDNTIINNTFLNNLPGNGGAGNAYCSAGNSGLAYGIGISLDSFDNTIDVSNTYNGEVTHYYYGINGVNIEGQTLTGSLTTNWGKITLINCNHFTIKDNVISKVKGLGGESGYRYGPRAEQGKIGAGIYLYLSNNGTITGNTLSDNQGGQGGSAGLYSPGGGYGGEGTGIYLQSCNNIKITDNDISGNIGGSGGNGAYYTTGGQGGVGSGIYLVSSDNNIIRENGTITANNGGNPNGTGVGIYLVSSEPTIIYNNIYANETYNLSTNISSGTQTAEYNWWGTQVKSEIVAKLSGNIDYEPWLMGTWTGTE